MLYQLLTGQLPFKSDSLLGWAEAHAMETPRPLHELRPRIADDLVEFINAALTKTPAARWQALQAWCQRWPHPSDPGVVHRPPAPPLLAKTPPA